MSAKKKKKKRLKTKAELESEVAAQEIHSRRYRERIKDSGKVYKRQSTKKNAEDEIDSKE